MGEVFVEEYSKVQELGLLNLASYGEVEALTGDTAIYTGFGRSPRKCDAIEAK